MDESGETGGRGLPPLMSIESDFHMMAECVLTDRHRERGGERESRPVQRGGEEAKSEKRRGERASERRAQPGMNGDV
jgi:hypothetical protein